MHVIVETGSGIDTLDFSTTGSFAVAVSLAIGADQVVNANLTLALSSGVLFENVKGGAQGDTLTGNSLANSLQGNAVATEVMRLAPPEKSSKPPPAHNVNDL